MNMRFFYSKSGGVTLIELLVAIAIAAIMIGVTASMLKAGFDVYAFAQGEMVLDKALGDCLDGITQGGFDANGIQDAMEIESAGLRSLRFVPLWIDIVEAPKYEQTQAGTVKKVPMKLSRPFKPGASYPIVEVSLPLEKGSRLLKWKPVPVEFVPAKIHDPEKTEDRFYLQDPVGPESMIRSLYQPDAVYFKDCAVDISLKDGRIARTYRGGAEKIPKYDAGGVEVSDIAFTYYDNTNTEIKIKPAQILNVTAIKVTITVSISGRTKTGHSFINIRNTKTGGAGLLIREGTRVRIPDSKRIRVFTLSNVFGAVEEGGKIEIEARPEIGAAWKATVYVGVEDDRSVISGYDIEYPSGSSVYSRETTLYYGEPLNFMNIGDGGRYDYDYDKGVMNTVDIEGPVELVVTRMDAQGAMLFIRP